MQVFNAHYGGHNKEPVSMGIFLNLYGGGQLEQYFDYRDHCTEPTLRSDMDPNVPYTQAQIYINILVQLQTNVMKLHSDSSHFFRYTCTKIRN